MKALTCLISACIGCCMNADFTHTNLQSFFENYKNCAHYVDEDQNGICDYCLNHEDLADKSCTHKQAEHRAHSNYR